MKARILMTAALTLILTACASVETMKQARGWGVKRVYPYASEQVYEATLEGAKRQSLDVMDSDRSAGMVVLSYGVTSLAWGGRIAVFFNSVNANSTEVEIINKPVLRRIEQSPDWDRILLDEIEFNLSLKKAK